jgi:hypothetical protein
LRLIILVTSHTAYAAPQLLVVQQRTHLQGRLSQPRHPRLVLSLFLFWSWRKDENQKHKRWRQERVNSEITPSTSCLTSPDIARLSDLIGVRA